ncbi:diflavin flavoprotein [Aphanothece sacrum]|uniref:Flavin reductase, FMN-binding protein n=1 Tax=Aphanothece sacrum FPU1 TaxID=1920663 RepID=A0A401IGE7_APHSA|nr:diflavin flavoprotein [Aphanothece sacrum]GBF80286.1 flavin reductase, FMN-binding protein [Aphanothece sacrum FPU1]GBF83692.1 flavin reductase domain-containing FMN-binding protein [Aphanothece sacrum FPU3]
MLKSRDVQVFLLNTDTLVLRSRTWDRLKFEIEYGLKRGTTSNSYLIQADKIALFDPPGESFTDIFLEALKQRIDPKKIDYVIVGHVNPNRSETLKKILEIAPQITIICSNLGAMLLPNLLFPQFPPYLKVVKGEDTLDLGKGHQLEFIPTPNPRYPDQLCTYDPKTEIIYTDKLFGSHVCGDQVFDEGWKVYAEDRRYYFDCLIAPYAKQVTTALEKLSRKSAKIYAPSHGPLVRYGLKELTSAYQELLKNQKSQELSVALIYASAYGNTAVLGQAIARGITKAGVGVESINVEVAEPDEIKEAIAKCSGFIFGSPTLGGHAPTQVQTALGITLANADKTKLTGVFGSYGWSGEAIDLLENKLKDGGYTFGFEPIRVKFTPTEATLKTCEEAGIDFAQAVKKAQKARKPKASVNESQTARTEQALGRIVGSLCVVTCREGEITGAMLASWVSQATFNPPGFTVAVAKDRAIESLLYQGSFFVLNILPDGKHTGLMKHFLKPFAPGEDRFMGVDIETAENGSPILKDALAYLECQVGDRMECGDHWVIYGIVKKGKVLHEGVSAIHHRKSGSYY